MVVPTNPSDQSATAIQYIGVYFNAEPHSSDSGFRLFAIGYLLGESMKRQTDFTRTHNIPYQKTDTLHLLRETVALAEAVLPVLARARGGSSGVAKEM